MCPTHEVLGGRKKQIAETSHPSDMAERVDPNKWIARKGVPGGSVVEGGFFEFETEQAALEDVLSGEETVGEKISEQPVGGERHYKFGDATANLRS